MDLRMRFLNGDEIDRIAILEEVLRLEPVVGLLYRRAEQNLILDTMDDRNVYRSARCWRSTFALSTPTRGRGILSSQARSEPTD